MSKQLKETLKLYRKALDVYFYVCDQPGVMIDMDSFYNTRDRVVYYQNKIRELETTGELIDGSYKKANKHKSKEDR